MHPLIATTGDWVAASFGGTLPSYNNDVIIPNGVTITLTAPTTIMAKSISFLGTGSLVVPLAAQRSTVRVTDRIFTYGTGGIVGGAAATQGTATATITNGSVTSIVQNTAGSGYTSQPTVIVTDPPAGAGNRAAQLTATLSGSGILSTNIVDGGAGYLTAPTIYYIGGNQNVDTTQERFVSLQSAGTFEAL